MSVSLLAYLAQQRHVLRTAYGLTDAQARETPSASSLSVGGLIKHVMITERGWMDILLQRPPAPVAEGEDAYEAGFSMSEKETLARLLETYEVVARETEAIIAAEPDMGRPVPIPKGVPWFPQDVDAWSVRWVLLHLIEETARHAGHADIVRECVDGATAFPLMAAAEGWPASPWMQPWEKGTSVGS